MAGDARRKAILHLLDERHSHVLALIKETNEASARRKDQLNVLIDERDRTYREMFASAEKARDALILNSREILQNTIVASRLAVDKAEAATEKRFDAVNEFRSQLRDQQLSLITRSESDARFKGLEEKLEIVKSYQITDAGKSQGAGAVWGWIAAAAATTWAIVETIRLLLNHT